jgi:phosphatidylglycerol:prolipoprotein diacylglycerol transferase
MLPELFHIGPIPIRAFGLTMALTFLAGVLYVRKMTTRDGKPFDPYLNVAYILIIGGIVGARLSYVLLHLSEFSGNWSSSFNPFGSHQFGIAGLNLYGGILFAIICSFTYLRFTKMNVLEVFDYFAPPLALGIGITRIGCFLNGCCWGTPTDLPWGVHFPHDSMPYACFGDQAIHPAQIYSSLYGFTLFFILHLLMRRKQFIGQIIAILFMSEAVARYAIEYVRYYENAMYFDFLGMHPTWNQVVSILLFVSGLVIYLVQRRRAIRKP